MEKVVLYDCTLRDGTQGENVSLSVDDKLHIAQKLDEFGIHYIEGGWPGSNQKDAEFFSRARSLSWKNSSITAFGSTRHWKNPVDQDPNLAALLQAETPAVTLVGKSWDFHVTRALGISLQQNLQIIQESIDYLKKCNREVIFDAEHFFDGWRANPEYALGVIKAARDAGADWIVLCDTNGGNLPLTISRIVGPLNSQFPQLGIHTHNDCDLGTANSLAAVESGAQMVQGTINGYGERCGNANLCSIIPALELKMNRHTVGPDKLKNLTSLAYFVSETANMIVRNDLPYVGKSAFAHKGGLHVSGILKDSRTYEHIQPEQIGNQRRVLVSDLSGKSNLIYKIQEFGDFKLEQIDLAALLERIKELEYDGYQFEGAEASLKLLLHEFSGQSKKWFDFKGFRVLVDQDRHGNFVSEATVKISVDGMDEHVASEGNGPVNALDRAIKKALARFFPEIEEIRLIDYKVRVLDAQNATAARVRVLIESTDGHETWTTIGVSENVIEASWKAIVDSLLYKLIFLRERKGAAAQTEVPNARTAAS
ncbi:MAG: citramalate synthase [Acidobacteria bacterium]|nr:citramalate synthase [Acidobacteriota bacterium]